MTKGEDGTVKGISIYLFIDALGWDVVEPTGFLSDVLPNRRAVDMQFGYSSSAIPTILSGRQPDEHGHLGLFAWAPERSPFRRVARIMRLMRPRAVFDRPRVRGWVSKAVKRALGITGYFQLYQMTPEKLPYVDYCEKRDLFVPGGMEGVANIADELVRAGVPHHISDWRRPDEENLAIGAKEVGRGTDFVFIYTAELDALRHKFATPSVNPEVKAKLAWYRQRILRLVAAAKSTGRPWTLTVFSDHGMTPLTKTVDLKGAVEATGLVLGRDYGACYDSTLFRVTYLKPGARERIEAALAPFAGDGRWLTEGDERENGVWRRDRAFGDAIFLVKPGVQIVPSDMGLAPLAGMHGFDPRDVHSKAAVMSTAPIPDWVRGVKDYFRLMKAGFEVGGPGNN